ncbi:N-acetylmannosamine-6-phosphate 2-epimerase [Microvirga tunisiensis]|jgi:N-acylglucosamine-6-phosphate 2-epimerase|uniref:Putative N-acetylmannosamine-6-phosphate 2-epimerase n=1 Tax=Microvirga tunisiensis TaxID=2108360 RepID=A0A5N7ML96_9HYPH|nr:N-acetylmannosamine-6-phosphate 2-epimerase [Microvirga tunisiensis]MPR09555.1 N-acetylmannosamine-6-phosphate 2-epimerase [Microvirga tunisiensis]MPR27767.1 N-acetylmannosamine-6-phosphate 2-epimerase [Microvirga tunisiensis]
MLIPKGALVVSCQARADNPLHGPVHMSAMAQAAQAGGAGGIRANGEADVAAIRAVTRLPIIGIAKVWDDRFPVYITPGFEQAAQIAKAGADIVGLDATPRPRDGEPVERLIGRIRAELGKEVFADVATLEEGRAAHAAGATYVATTLSGYTEETASRKTEGPDLELLSALVAEIPAPIVAEGRFDAPDLVAEAFRRGAHAVVVGTAITNPREITRNFVRAISF